MENTPHEGDVTYNGSSTSYIKNSFSAFERGEESKKSYIIV